MLPRMATSPCDVCVEDLAAFLEHKLAHALYGRLVKHLLTCDECFDVLGGLADDHPCACTKFLHDAVGCHRAN